MRALRVRGQLVWAFCFALACERATSSSSFPGFEPREAGVTSESDPDDTEPIIDVGGEGPRDEPLDPTLGGRCLDDRQCDDGIDCTFDACDLELGRCRFTPDDRPCQDDVYCNGRERCVPNTGCRPGPPLSCDDQDPCTIDRCIEESQSCERTSRDVDGDGDPDARCPYEGGGDCDDQDPLVSSQHPEICGNRKDDDCDGEVDEADCRQPAFDSCAEAFEVEASGTFRLPLDVASPDTAASCSAPGARDVFVRVRAEQPSDVIITVRGTTPDFSAALRSACADVSSELLCATPSLVSREESVVRLTWRAVESGEVTLVVFQNSTNPIEASIDYQPPSSPPSNETCASATPIVPGERVLVDLLDATPDEVSACFAGGGDLVYEFTLEEASDVRVFAPVSDPLSTPLLSLRGDTCPRDTELTCTRQADVELFARGLPPGRYFLAVSATQPARFEVLLLLEPASSPVAGDRCDDPLTLRPGRARDVDLSTHSDQVALPCFAGGRDAVLSLELEEPSDVLVKQRASAGDATALALLPESCDPRAALACVSAEGGPSRVIAHRLPAGSHRVVTESRRGNPVELFAAVRPARAPILVLDADDCASAIEIPPWGGNFVGNTSRANADFSASCDVGSATPGGAPDQILKLVLEQRSRVFLDTRGSAYRVLLDVRTGPECPGTELPFGCVSAEQYGSSFEAVLDPGVYFVQVDGYAGLSGQWNLEIFVLPE